MTPIRVRVFPVLATIFLIVPIIEIYLLIQVGGLIGVIPTIGLVVLTAVIGVALLRVQGLQTYLRFNQALNAGRLPATEILEGVGLVNRWRIVAHTWFFYRCDRVYLPHAFFKEAAYHPHLQRAITPCLILICMGWEEQAPRETMSIREAMSTMAKLPDGMRMTNSSAA